MLNSSANTAQAIASAADIASSLGEQLLAALPTLRLQSLCLLDARGEPLWLSEGMVGPDEQGCIQSALTTFTATNTKAHTQELYGDNQAALFLAVRGPQWRLSGMVMLLMEARTLGSGNLAARILTSAMRDLLQQTAQALGPAPAPVAEPAPALAAAEPSEELVLHTLEPEPVPGPLPVPIVDADIDVKLDLTGTNGEITRSDIPPLSIPGTGRATMLLQEFERLRAGGNSRRYKVSPEEEKQRGNTAVALEQLLKWIRANPEALLGAPVSFTFAVSGSALKDERLLSKLAALLVAAPLKPDQIGFEIREPACLALRPQVERLLAWCERSGCFAVIDDFSFESAGLDLLRSSAVKLLKVDAKLGSEALRDKLAQARVVAIVQAAKILGLHCVAKYIDSKSGRQWLTAVGFDFAQSMGTDPLERLLI